MKIRFNFNNPQMKMGCDGKLKSCENKDTPGEPAFCEIDLNFLYMAYKMAYNIFPLKIGSPGAGKAITKLPDLNNQIYEDAAGIPRLLPANGHDMYNYVARYGAANFQTQTVMKLNGKLDPDKLKKAVRLSVDVEPVFGCRFIENESPYWKRLDDLDNTEFCSFEKAVNMGEAVQRFLDSPFSMDNDPMVKLRLISSASYDTLCLKNNHTCCDGTGTKEYLQLLSEIYSSIDQDNGVFVPKPRIRNRWDQDRLFNALGIKDPETAWNNNGEIPELLWTFPWRQGQPDVARVVVCKLPYGYINIMSRYGKARGATINDILLTAFYRAMFEFSQPQYGIPMHIPMTVDLRRYLPDQKTGAIRNFSGGIDTKLTRVANEPFAGTLSRIVPMMNEIKKGRPGLQSAVGLERVERANFYDTLAFYRDAGKKLTYTDEFAPVLSNLSYISKSPLKFGKTTVTDAYIVPPALSAPGYLLCVSTYNGLITFAVSYYESQARREDIERVLNLIKKEIMEGCRG